MPAAESLEAFYDAHPARRNDRGLLQTGERFGHFNVYPRGAYCRKTAPYNRRDFYKISLIIGKGVLHYADRDISVDGRTLVFLNPLNPYAWESFTEPQDGYFCFFSEAFMEAGSGKAALQDSPLSALGDCPVFPLDDGQTAFITGIFLRMLEEKDAVYAHKSELLYHYVQILVHEALKMRPAASPAHPRDGATRITSLFLELLEGQFPVDADTPALTLRTANEYAGRLAVHVNYLNRAVKKATGRTTTEHIAARMLKEAKALLLHSDRSVAEIAYALGFEYPAYFHRFFKTQTRQTPGEFRRSSLV